MIKKGDTAGIVCCSDGISPERRDSVEKFKEILEQMGLKTIESPYIYQKDRLAAAPPKQRAAALMEMYRNPEVKGIFDISGGNLANQILEYLDFARIGQEEKEFWGYSDLTVVLNAIYAKTGKSSRLYQVRNLAGTYGKEQQERFGREISQAVGESLLPDRWKFLQGDSVEGILLGGNIRCFLKLAGTEYFPDLEEKVLFLESRSGGEGAIATMFAQLRQMGVFDKVRGLLLGTFTELDALSGREAAERIALEAVGNPRLPVARTLQVGHGQDSRALQIGSWFSLEKIEKF
ncbi:MAG: LD-carboxypeptidase [Clostridiales bacterium]|nr:LD-carboxypeptidase [Clostridiales bacterium]